MHNYFELLDPHQCLYEGFHEECVNGHLFELFDEVPIPKGINYHDFYQGQVLNSGLQTFGEVD